MGRLKTAMELLGVRKYIRYYRSGMLLEDDKLGRLKYTDKDDLVETMRHNYAYNVAEYEAENVGKQFSDSYFNSTYLSICNMKWPEIEADAMARRLRGEPWIDKFKECF